MGVCHNLARPQANPRQRISTTQQWMAPLFFPQLDLQYDTTRAHPTTAAFSPSESSGYFKTGMSSFEEEKEKKGHNLESLLDLLKWE